MNRRSYLRLAGSGLLGVAGCTNSDSPPADTGTTTTSTTTTSSPDAELVNPSFESGLAGWTVGKDLPEDPNGSGEPVNNHVQTATDVAREGETALDLYIEGVADDGTVWVEQSVDFTGVSVVVVHAYSEQQSFNILSNVAFFAGAKPDGGLIEANFDRENDIEDHAGWKAYTYDVADASGRATLAVGMNVVWETGIRRFLDYIQFGRVDG